MKCPFCSGYHELPIKKEEVEEHLIVTTSKNFHFHVHGPISQKSLMKQFLLKIAKEAGIDIEDEEIREVKGKANGGGGNKDNAEKKTNKVKVNAGSRIDQDQIIEVSGKDQERSAEGHQSPIEEAQQYSSEGCKISDR